MHVEDAMSTDLVTCAVEASLRVATKRMVENHVGSVIVHADGSPTGIVTETDALHAGTVTDAPFSEIPVRKVMSSPLKTITPSRTLRAATEQMHEENVKKLVVVEDMDLVGIVTTADVIRHYHDLKSEIHDLLSADRVRSTEADRFALEDF